MKGGIIASVLLLIIAVVIITTFTWEVPEVENYLVSQPYTFESSIVRETQAKRFLWLFDHTRVQYQVINTDVSKGNFNINFIFDDGKATATVNKVVGITPGQVNIVTSDSPLNGQSSVTVKVIPPNKSILQQRTVMKKVTVLDYVGLGWILTH